MSYRSFFALPLPTLDRPFGIHLWSIFDKVFATIVGYSANEFQILALDTPMVMLKSTGLCLAGYYVIILGGRELMQDRKTFKLASTLTIHNFI